MSIKLTSQEITSVHSDVVINSANPALAGIGPDLPAGVGGVDGAIHRAAGLGLWHYCISLPEVENSPFPFPTRCLPGKCVVTPAFKMNSRWIVHVVAPVYDKENSGHCFNVLAESYDSIFAAVHSINARLVLMTPIGTRSFGFPKFLAAKLALEKISLYAKQMDIDVIISLVDEEEYEIYRTLLSYQVP